MVRAEEQDGGGGGKKNEDAVHCASRATCRKLLQPRTLSYLGPTSFVCFSLSRAFLLPSAQHLHPRMSLVFSP